MLFKDLSIETIKATIAKERMDVKIQHDNIIEKLKDFYEDRQGLDKYIKDWGFKKKNNKTDLPLQTINLTKKIIEKISLTYKKQPVRTTVDIDPEEDDPIKSWYNQALQFTLGYKYSERYKNLIGKVLRRAHYDTVRKTWHQFIETKYEPHFLGSDVLHPVAFSYPVGQNLRDVNADEDWWMFWSDKEMFYYLPGTNKTKTDEYGGKNPFGILPMVEDRADFPIDQYDAVGALSLVNTNQNINIALNDLNLMVHTQAFDQPIITGINKEDAGDIEIGPQKFLMLSEPDSSASLLGFNPKITECIEAIKFNVQTIGYTYNLSINWSIEGNPASGFSLLVQNIDLLEARQDDVELAILGEKSMFEIIKKMQGFYKSDGKLGDEPIIPIKAEMAVDFQELDFPINQTEELQVRDWLIKHNIKSELDYIIADNPDMTIDQAAEKHATNKRINKEYGFGDAIKERITKLGGNIEE